MILKQYYLGCLAHASYLIADESTGVAAVVDPQRDVDGYLADAKEQGLTIRHVFLTHFHADFLAGHLELRDRVGAAIHLGGAAQAEYAFEPARDGDVIDLGKVRLRILETPGHTPEGISILVFDLEKDERHPHAVLTGDTLFIGDVGRPDLMAAVGITAEELAGSLYDSLHGKLLALPDETLVYPAHGAGSACGKNLSTDTVSTIGNQRLYNYALQSMSKEAFVGMVTANLPAAPGYFSYDAELNRQERETLEASLARALTSVSLDEALRLQAEGDQVVDVRPASDFAGAHLAGSLNIGLDGKYATWAGTLLSQETPIVLVADPGREEEAAMRLGRIGFDRVAGFLEGGMLALAGSPDLVTRVDRITVETLAEQLGGGGEVPVVIDVRNAGEGDGGGIEGSVNIPLNEMPARLDEVPADRPVVVHCASGYRSSLAASLLQRAGRTNVQDLVGGYTAWASRSTRT